MTTGESRPQRHVLRLLTALAKSGAEVEIERGPDGTVERVAVVRGGGATPDRLLRADAETWREAVRSGAVAMDAAGRWRVTQAGRKRLAAGGDQGSARNKGAAGGDAAESSRPARPVENVAESPLTWLRNRRDRNGTALITEAQFDAGERLRADFERGQLAPRITANWSGFGGGSGANGAHRNVELSDGALAARERVNGALHEVGPEMARVLLEVCCHLKGLEQLEREAGWPQRSAKVVLTMALTALARHYRIGNGSAPRSGAIRHWGAADYRPPIDGA